MGGGGAVGPFIEISFGFKFRRWSYTRMRCVSGLSLEAVWSAIVLHVSYVR